MIHALHLTLLAGTSAVVSAQVLANYQVIPLPRSIEQQAQQYAIPGAGTIPDCIL